MQRLDRILAALLILLGCIHAFIAAPIIYGEITARALWFASAGLALLYAGFINLLRARAPSRDDQFLGWLCVLTNASMLMFVLAYGLTTGAWADPQGSTLIAAVAVLTATSILQLRALRRRRRPANAHSVA